MEEIVNYVQPELMILVPVLYLVGIGLKKTSLVSDRLPAGLGHRRVPLRRL